MAPREKKNNRANPFKTAESNQLNKRRKTTKKDERTRTVKNKLGRSDTGHWMNVLGRTLEDAGRTLTNLNIQGRTLGECTRTDECTLNDWILSLSPPRWDPGIHQIASHAWLNFLANSMPSIFFSTYNLSASGDYRHLSFPFCIVSLPRITLVNHFPSFPPLQYPFLN